jgi:hypothetical protein
MKLETSLPPDGSYQVACICKLHDGTIKHVGIKATAGKSEELLICPESMLVELIESRRVTLKARADAGAQLSDVKVEIVHGERHLYLRASHDHSRANNLMKLPDCDCCRMQAKH